MTKGRLPRRRGDHIPSTPLDLRLFVLLSACGAMVWLAVARPAVAAAITLGLSVFYLLHRLIGR